MTEQGRRRVRFSLLVAIAAVLVTWAILGERSPVAGLAERSRAAEMWRVTVVPAFMLAAVDSGNPHSPPMALVAGGLFVQWAVVGYLLSALLPGRHSRSR